MKDIKNSKKIKINNKYLTLFWTVQVYNTQSGNKKNVNAKNPREIPSTEIFIFGKCRTDKNQYSVTVLIPIQWKGLNLLKFANKIKNNPHKKIVEKKVIYLSVKLWTRSINNHTIVRTNSQSITWISPSLEKNQ